MAGRVTIKDVAREAGVSYQTVSKVINHQARVKPETERSIRQAIERLGYTPHQAASSLRSRRTRLIGYSGPPFPLNQANPILDVFLQSMLHAAEEAGYHLLCFPHHPGERQVDLYRRLVNSNQVDGFVVSGVEYDDARLRYLLEMNFPFVAFGRSNLDMKFSFVDVDGESGMRSVVEHLLSLGRRRIAALTWPETSRVGKDRMSGYRLALEAAGIEVHPEWIARGEGNQAFGRQATQAWLDVHGERRPDAVAACNDAMAVGAMQAIQEAGLRVGVDLAVTGFDDLPMTQFLTPPLTTVRLPVAEIGRQVIKILVGILDGKITELRHELLVPDLIVRQSSSG